MSRLASFKEFKERILGRSVALAGKWTKRCRCFQPRTYLSCMCAYPPRVPTTSVSKARFGQIDHGVAISSYSRKKIRSRRDKDNIMAVGTHGVTDADSIRRSSRAWRIRNRDAHRAWCTPAGYAKAGVAHEDVFPPARDRKSTRL